MGLELLNELIRARIGSISSVSMAMSTAAMIHTKALSSRLTHPMAMVVAINGHCPTVALIARAGI